VGYLFLGGREGSVERGMKCVGSQRHWAEFRFHDCGGLEWAWVCFVASERAGEILLGVVVYSMYIRYYHT
jgi:hypothetical protein